MHKLYTQRALKEAYLDVLCEKHAPLLEQIKAEVKNLKKVINIPNLTEEQQELVTLLGMTYKGEDLYIITHYQGTITIKDIKEMPWD